MAMEKCYKVSEFAKLIGVSPKSLQRWDKNGLLVADRTDGCHWSYTQKHIDEFEKIRTENAALLSRKKHFSYEDLTGKWFGQLEVIERAEDWIGANGHRHITWRCKCHACGGETVIKGASLRAGYNKTCGCSQYGDSETKRMWAEYQAMSEDDAVLMHTGRKVGRPAGFKGGGNSFQDLTGKDFGFWHVIERGDTKKYARGQIIYWKCRCRCGIIKQVPGRDLRSGASQSCGCMSKISWLEYFTREWLDTNGFSYEYQKSYNDLLGTGGKPLVYDFVVNRDGLPICVIECQGEQHYRPVKKFGGAKKLMQQQIHDRLKKDYAETKLRVPMIEVLYTVMSEFDIYTVLENSLIKNL